MFSRFFIISILSLFSLTSYAGTEGHGGDHYAIEFMILGKSIVRSLEVNPISGVDIAIFRQTVNATKVESKENLTIGDGLVKDAFNYPDKKLIELSRASWNQLGTKWREKTMLVFHEYLGIMNLDRNYEISSKLDHKSVISYPESLKFYITNVAGFCDYRGACPTQTGTGDKTYQVKLIEHNPEMPRIGEVTLYDPFWNKHKNTDVGRFWARLIITEEIPGVKYTMEVQFGAVPNYQNSQQDLFGHEVFFTFYYPTGFESVDFRGAPILVGSSNEERMYVQNLKVRLLP